MSRMIRIAGLVVAVSVHAAASWAITHECDRKDQFDGRPIFKRAQEAEQAGRFKDAYADGRKVHETCATGVDQPQAKALLLRVARRQAEVDDKQARFDEAADWYLRAGTPDDADRAMLKFAHAAPQDLKVFRKAFAFFNGGRPGGRSEALLKEVRKIAAAAGERELANEDKLFSPLRDTQDELTRARDWLLYVEGGEKTVFDRATRRGDALARDDAPGPLERSLAYYRFARNAAREKELRERAERIGKQHAAKGDSALAVRYFELAGQTGKAKQLAGDVQAQEQRAEKQRRKAFDKDAKALEKELGL